MIENDRIVVSHALGYSIYADIGSAGTSLLFASDSPLWNDEIFVKLS